MLTTRNSQPTIRSQPPSLRVPHRLSLILYPSSRGPRTVPARTSAYQHVPAQNASFISTGFPPAPGPPHPGIVSRYLDTECTSFKCAIRETSELTTPPEHARRLAFTTSNSAGRSGRGVTSL